MNWENDAYNLVLRIRLKMLLFTELIQVSLGSRKSLSKTPSNKDWEDLLEMSVRQAVAGVVFEALDNLATNGQKIPPNLLFEWIGISEQIKEQNLLLNKRCKEITQLFADAGYKTCILKGQGNAKMYPNALSRTPGDIDVWVYGKYGEDKIPICSLQKEIISFVRERTPEAFEQSYHVEFPIFKDVMIEVHYVPIILFNPNQDRKFREWYQSIDTSIFLFCEDAGFSVPSIQFNAVYQMVHIYSHFFTEGIGMRHFVDYYYVLKQISSSDIISTKEILHQLGMIKFSSGVMWIEHKVLGISENYLIVKPSESVGRLIMKEMEKGGNFGQYDQRYSARNKGLIVRGLVDTWRLMTLARVFPTECFWKIAEKITNQKYKLKQHRLRI